MRALLLAAAVLAAVATAADAAEIRGTASYRGRMALPPDGERVDLLPGRGSAPAAGDADALPGSLIADGTGGSAVAAGDAARGFRIEGGALVLLDAAGAPLARLHRRT